MSLGAWFLAIGVVLLLMALNAAFVKRLPLSSAMVYLAVGVVLGPTGLGAFEFEPADNSGVLEVITEVAVLISLFAAGLKLAAPLGHRSWWQPFSLATLTMGLSITMVAAAGVYLLDLSWAAAILLGAILAPTDPVLASDVQVKDVRDRSTLRFSLTGEAGLNDGMAFPFVMLGLGLLGAHELGQNFERWLLVDVLWATASGTAVGGGLGALFAWVVSQFHRRGLHTEYMDDFFGLGLMTVSYGAALVLHGYGFLAVFAAGFMLHRTEKYLGATLERPDDSSATSQSGSEQREEDADPHMTMVSLRFVEQLERLAEVGMLLLIGGMLSTNSWSSPYLVLAILMMFLFRPLAVHAGLLMSRVPQRDRWIIAYFGIRGIGSLYYLAYALEHGLDGSDATVLVSATLVVVAVSVILHGLTVSPITRRFARD